MRNIADENDLAYGLEQLILRDSRFCEIAARAGALPMRKSPHGFEGLAYIIVGQMVSRASADAIWRRMSLEPHIVSAAGYLTVGDAKAREYGLSTAKHQTLRNLAERTVSRQIDLDELVELPSEEVHRRLVALKGIGPWTTDVYLLFALGHPDVFPFGDVALQAAAAHALDLHQRPSEKDLKSIALIWQPWRSIAARVLWAYYGAVLKRGVTRLP